jgi:hypothetical protein
LPRELRQVGVAQTLGDDALEVGVDYGPVERSPFGEHDLAGANVMALNGKKRRWFPNSFGGSHHLFLS